MKRYVSAFTIACAFGAAAAAPERVTRGGSSTRAGPAAEAATDAWRDIVEVERNRLQLDRERFQDERNRRDAEAKRAEDKPGFWATVIGSSLVGAVVAGAFSLLGLMVERRQKRGEMWDELVLARSTELAKNRMDKYTQLWGQLKWLSLYPLPKGLHTTEIASIHDELRKWYFDHGGGMFLSLDHGGQPGSRTRYLALQSALKRICDEVAGKPSVLVSETDKLTSEEARQDEDQYDAFRAESPLPAFVSGFARYRFVRALGSRLRSAIIEDLGTRAAPLIAMQAA
jgi:hypothetical protein